ncbi:phosphoribosylformylglycinamidine synthase subunit PurQ [Desulfurispirillum indicum]|uniref:phosphoribosylformylglycinamidine synthase subunit PurQ n=1 Tax=Desulfurispirillum indicum TaxID=936456 RepID=UPI001CFB9F29|nr:phosphoribosylformylglycinamidine synthase subunit PurQ [Desulfurispirillum indicum]UCZ55847.1 phosphoribosylformylglycinamidine synthase subunit PurQ [Desulfurispirillum indicum]
MNVGVVVFPGSNCDHDCDYAATLAGANTRFIWHKEGSVGNVDAIILPGGFSYGDYLRCGAIAKNSPVMADVIRFASEGRPVIGICNGFQILLESGLLPGALMCNNTLKFLCRNTSLRVETTRTPFTRKYRQSQVINVPVAHHDGSYYADEHTLQYLDAHDMVVFRYQDNPNGSLGDIAGICNEKGNVLGMMPHPERVVSPELGGTDGAPLFESLLEYVVSL